MKFFYARCSTRQQNEARQMELARELGITEQNIFLDKKSGKNVARPALQDMLSRLREGDQVYISELSRLGRNTKDLLELVDEFNGKGVDLISKKEAIDTSTPAGKLAFTVFAAIAEFQREIILDNIADGRAAAAHEGKLLGRPKVDAEKLSEALTYFEHRPDMSIKAIVGRTGISRSVIYREAEKRGLCRAKAS